MAKANILIVEDDENLRVALEDNLEDEGYGVKAAANGKTALAELARGETDLVILDIMLPDTDGYSICRKTRDNGGPVRVPMLTARSLESDLVEGFDAGADDYLSKPYRLRELLARVGALLRRKVVEESPAASDIFRFGRFELDAKARILRDDAERELTFTRTEFDLLLCLLKNQGRALSREEILAAAWDKGVVVDPRTVDNFVSNVKKKLDWKKSDNYRIKTVRGGGYRFELD